MTTSLSSSPPLNSTTPSNRLCGRMTACGWEYLGLTVILLVVAMVGQINLIFLMVGIFLAPVLLNRWIARRAISALSLQREHPLAVRAGEEFDVELTARSRGRRFGWNFTAQDHLLNLQNPNNPPTLLQCFFPGFRRTAEQRATIRLRLDRRGAYRFGPFQISTETPFGLYHSERNIGADSDALWVFPRPGRFSSQWRLRRSIQSESGGAQRIGPGLEFFGVREWRMGDSQRTVHWRASAKHRQWIVRQFAEPRKQAMTILLDMYLPMSSHNLSLFSPESSSEHSRLSTVPLPTSADATSATASRTEGTTETSYAKDRYRLERGVALVTTLLLEQYRHGGGLFRLEITGQQSPTWTKTPWPTSYEMEPLITSSLRQAMQRLAVAQPHTTDTLETVWQRIAGETRSAFSQQSEYFVISLRDRPNTFTEKGTSLQWLCLRSSECDTLFKWSPTD